MQRELTGACMFLALACGSPDGRDTSATGLATMSAETLGSTTGPVTPTTGAGVTLVAATWLWLRRGEPDRPRPAVAISGDRLDLTVHGRF